jgi:carbon starvation protein
LLVAGWGSFLIQGVVDPLGGINTLWPIFGIANQLLAVIAFCLGTTVLIKMGRARYAFVTVGPLLWLIVVTFTAGYQKIFSPGAAGFIPLIASMKAKLATAPADQIASIQKAIFNNQVDVAVTAAFLLSVAVITLGCAWEWVKVLRGAKPAQLRESPYVTLPDAV